MARRPNFSEDDSYREGRGSSSRSNEVMNAEDLKKLRSSLSRLGRSAALQAYHTAYARCRMVNDHVPSARSIQELVQVWKQLWKRLPGSRSE
jgi:hypothetical protein